MKTKASTHSNNNHACNLLALYLPGSMAWVWIGAAACMVAKLAILEAPPSVASTPKQGLFYLVGA